MEGWEVLGLAFGWVLIIEGITPLVFTEKWMRMLEDLARVEPRYIRAAASVIVALGLVVVWGFLGKLP